MRIVLTAEAKDLIPASLKYSFTLVHRAGCSCSGLHIFVEYASWSPESLSSQRLAYEQVGEVDGIPVFMSEQLRNYLEYTRVHTLAIGAEESRGALTATPIS